jgi:hypothetical protein
MNIDQIQVGFRYRKDLGDLRALAESIAEVGLLHPVVVTPEGRLIAGQRRLEACRSLGWAEIPVTIVDLLEAARGEAHENLVRKDLLPSEIVALKRAIEPLERRDARERQGHRPDLCHPASRDADHGYVFVQGTDGPCIACMFPGIVNDDHYPCPGTPAVADILQATGSFAVYAVDTLTMNRSRTWNYRRLSLSDPAQDGGSMVAQRDGCELCNQQDKNKARAGPDLLATAARFCAGLPNPNPSLCGVIRDWAHARGRNLRSYWKTSCPDERYPSFAPTTTNGLSTHPWNSVLSQFESFTPCVWLYNCVSGCFRGPFRTAVAHGRGDGACYRTVAKSAADVPC